MQTNQPATDNKSVALQRIDTLKSAIGEDYVQNQLQVALAENTGSFTASLIDLFTSDKYLQECEPKQVILQAMKAAMLKLPINKSLGYGYIIAYNKVPEFQLGYKGLIQLALRTGQYKTINCDVVYKGELKTVNKLTGEIDITGTAVDDTVVGYFAYFELKTGFSKMLYMTKEKVEKHAAKYSKSYTQANGAWKKEFDAMAKKTVLRNLLSHYGQMSVEVATALDKDDVADRVQDEISANGNSKPMHFDNIPEAEMVSQDNSQQNQSHIPPRKTEGAPF
jgi:recombination protein RecT